MRFAHNAANCKFHENLHRECHDFLMGIN